MFGSYRFAPFVLACLPALGLTSAAEAQTQTVCFTGSVPLQSTNWTSSVTVPKFNPALGTLQQVTFRLDGHVEGSASVESLDTSATVVQLLYAASITLQRPDATVIVTGMPNTMFTDSLGPFDGVIDFGGPSGASHLGISINSTDNATSPPPASDLVLFSGAGTITLPINGVGLSQAVGSGNVITQFITRASAVVQVCYIYAPCACTSAPVISGCTPGSVDLGCNPTNIPGCTSGVTAADNCEPVPVTCSVSDTSNGCVNTRVVTYSATNACGTTTCSQTYTWTVDTTPPTFDNCVSGNTDLGCNPTSLPVCDPGVTASDNCGPATVTCTSSDVVNGCVTTRTLVYTARDACNNTTTCARTFTWTTDTTPPTFDTCVDDLTDLGCNPTNLPVCDPGVTASDNCGPATVTCTSSDVVNGCVTTRTLVYTARDACNNTTTCARTFTWTTDTTPPTFDNCVGGNTDLGCNPTVLPKCDAGVTATDNCGPAKVTCASSDVVNGCVTTRTLVYTASDACNNQTSCTQTFTWTTDTTPPTFDNCVSGNTDLGCNPTNLPVCDPGVTASDNCGPATVTCTSSDVVNGCVTTRTLVYTARDACNNTTTCARTFTWTTDTTPPTFNNCVSGNTDLGCNPTNLPVCDPGVTASDNCGPAAVTCTSSDVVNGCVTTRTLVYTARDACNNTTTCARTFTWTTDTTPPTFDNCVSGNTDLGPNPTVIPGCDAGITASDNCGSATVTCAFTDSSTGCSNVRTVTYTARDACGNTATCTRTYTWGAAGQICATKYYDANANGVRDPGEPGIPGWKFRLSDGQTGFTDANGRVCFNSTGAGTYTVTELSPIQNNWAATTPTTCQVTISASNCSAECSFGNYCFSNPSRGLTIGYWRNKNGRRVLEQNDPAWRTLLNSLNLRKADGSLFTVPTSGSFSNAFDAWAVYLQGANATNMAYMLSAQLGATSLNVAFNGLSDATTIIVPGGVKSGSTCLVPFLSTTQAIVCGAPPLLTLTGQPGSSACGCNSNNGATTIGNLRNRAVCLLGTYNVTTSAGTPRTYEECVKNLLDMINNNGNNGSPCGGLTQYVNPSSTNCPITFP